MTIGILAAASFAVAQRPRGGGEGGPGPADAQDLVARMMAFDNDKDGKLAKAEVTDGRLQRLFDRADADRDGTVTREELTALEAREQATDRGGPPGGGPPGGGPGRPMMGPSRPGEVLPAMLQQRLGVTPEQKAQLADLQKDVDARLEKILDEEQKKQLKEMRDRGPGGFGPRGGGRPGGEPPPPDRPQ